MNKRVTKTIAFAAIMMLPVFASAHTGHGVNGFASGILHPFTGLDHLLTIFAVGLWSARQTGISRWATPLMFLLFMITGAGAAVSGQMIMFVEAVIVASVIVMGTLVALDTRQHSIAGMLLAAAFGFFHGYAHGAEIPNTVLLIHYGLGFIVATAVLLVAGQTLDQFSCSRSANLLRRAAGAAIALSGLVMAVY